MPRFTPEMIKKIHEEYYKTPVYKAVAVKLGIDERAVANAIKSGQKGSVAAAVAFGATTTTTASSFYSPSANNNNNNDPYAKKASQMSTDERYTVLYSEFLSGQTCNQIIAKYGFAPSEVQREYNNYCMLNHCDVAALQRSVFERFEVKDKYALRAFSDSFTKKGYLTNREQLSLIDSIIGMEVKDKIQNVIGGDLERVDMKLFPAGCHFIVCPRCKACAVGIIRTATVNITSDSEGHAHRIEIPEAPLCSKCSNEITENSRKIMSNLMIAPRYGHT